MLAARAWSDALTPLPRALACNLFSAACTAAAGAALAWLLARSTGHALAAFAATLCAGATATVWRNATETEVYAPALLLAMLSLLSAERAGRGADPRWVALTAYLFGLAVSLHLTALVAAPAAIALAVPQRSRWRHGAPLLASLALTVAVGLASAWLAIAALVFAVAAVTVQDRGGRAAALGVVAAAVVGLSVLLFLPVRAAHDPAVNTGNPVTWDALWHLVARRQYGDLPLWPRQAPVWLQVANVAEWADWQFALGLSPGVAPSWARTPLTLLFGVLGFVGSAAHRRRDRRLWRALALLLVCATLGVVAYLNLKAGPSYGYGVIPESAPREARERDYFFALAFWVWGAWAGYGAVDLATRLSRAAVPLGVLLAAAPVALNWRAVDRRGAESSLPRLVASALLWSAPPAAVLIAAGDNDAFPLWYAQVVEQRRPDVTVITVPLLGAAWYRQQLARRESLLGVDGVSHAGGGAEDHLRAVAERARRLGRPMAVGLPAADRYGDLLPGGGTLRGFVLVDGPAVVDTATTAEFIRRFGAPPRVRESTDPVAAFMARLLACPARALREGTATSLDSICVRR